MKLRVALYAFVFGLSASAVVADSRSCISSCYAEYDDCIESQQQALCQAALRACIAECGG